jgi:hypothetical protein
MEFRQCEKLVDEDWVPVEFEQLKEGDTFRLFENGLVICEAVAEGDPFQVPPDGNWGIKATEIFQKEQP